MTDRELNIKIFKKEPVNRILFQPRLETWYFKNKAQGTLPERYKNMNHLELYRDLECSIRPYGLFNPCLKKHFSKNVKVERFEKDDLRITKWETPIGSIEERRRDVNTSWHVEKFPVQTPQDMRIIEYILKDTIWSFDMELYESRNNELKDLAAPTLFIPRTNYQRLVVDLMGFENTMYALFDYPDETGHLMKVINETDKPMLKVVAHSPVEIINFGDNVDQNFLSPKILEKYLLPEYHERSTHLKKHSKFTHAHFDGSVKNILLFLKITKLDGIEALTPFPQGDVTIDEIKEALGEEMILLDGIPMTDFLPNTPVNDLQRDVEKIVQLFAPNLVLGVSDEISEICDIERIRLVSEMVKDIRIS